MKTLQIVYTFLDPYLVYASDDAAYYKKTLLIDNIWRLKIIGAIGSLINLLLLILYFMADGLAGLTTIEGLLRIAWILASILYIVGVDAPQRASDIRLRQRLFFYCATGLSLLFASLITAVLSIEQGSTFLYLINVLLIGSFLYLSALEMLFVISPSLIVLILAMVITPTSILRVQGNSINVFASIAFAVVIAQTILTAKLKQLENTRTILQQKAQLEQQIDLDGLTHIPNRRMLASYQPDASVPLVMLMIDIDFFKYYNDTYGHLQGDQCLIAVAQRLADDPGASLALRYGGEEFLLILRPTAPPNLAATIDSIRQGIADLKIPHEASLFGIVTVSIGYVVCTEAIFPTAGTSFDPSPAIKKADQALYQAKAEGRNRICRFEE
ncbi:GGDEF domain-containing protein [Acetobacterium bakii]|uniref:GGDEF domain-containing protein n=1 Tax=Acetobacterium bakii TaxID=52689 RepID=UPI000680BC5A|nr:GGDEF domain-containing protein [Acetobacterium bakii]